MCILYKIRLKKDNDKTKIQNCFQALKYYLRASFCSKNVLKNIRTKLLNYVKKSLMKKNMAL